MEDRFANRRKDFKKGAAGAEDSRRLREDETIQIRKKEREEQLAHRRRLDDAEEEFIPVPSQAFKFSTAENIAKLPELLQSMQQGAPDVKLKAVQTVRKMLSVENQPPIEPVISMGFIPYFVDFLKAEAFPEIQFEAAWALTNIASGTPEQTRIVVDYNTIPLFIALIASPHADVKEQAVWALGNIAGDNPEMRNTCLRSGIVERLLQLIRTAEKVSILRTATWCIGNLCRGKPQPTLESIMPAIPALVNLINQEDQEVIVDACWALSYISDGSNDRIQAVIESGAVRRLVDLLNNQSTNVQTPALRTVGNLVTGDDRQTQTVLQQGMLPVLKHLMSHTKKNLRKEACWAISNITAGTKEQITEVFNAGCVPKLIDICQKGEFDVKKEAVWALANSTSDGTADHIAYLVSQGIIPAFCGLLKVRDTRMVIVILEALDHILAAWVPQPGVENAYLQAIEECDGLTQLESLQSDDNEDVYKKAIKVLEYFPQEGEAEETSQTFGGLTSGAFSFQAMQQ